MGTNDFQGEHIFGITERDGFDAFLTVGAVLLHLPLDRTVVAYAHDKGRDIRVGFGAEHFRVEGKDLFITAPAGEAHSIHLSGPAEDNGDWTIHLTPVDIVRLRRVINHPKMDEFLREGNVWPEDEFRPAYLLPYIDELWRLEQEHRPGAAADLLQELGGFGTGCKFIRACDENGYLWCSTLERWVTACGPQVDEYRLGYEG